MTSQKKIMKLFIFIILAVFLLSSGLVSVMYFVDMNKNVSSDNMSGEVLSGEIQSWDNVIDLSSIGQTSN